MAKKRAKAPNRAENLPSASQQEDGKMIPAFRRTVNVPIIRPLANTNEPLAYQKVELPSADEIARRWGAHQQSIKEQMEKKKEQEKKTEKRKKRNQAPASNQAPSSGNSGPITRETMIMDLVTNHSEVLPILMDVGLHCIGCQLSAFDTVEAGCALHGFDSETIDNLIKTMNTVILQTRKDQAIIDTNAAIKRKSKPKKQSK